MKQELAGLLALSLAAGSFLLGMGHGGGKDEAATPTCSTALLKGRYALSGPGNFAGGSGQAVETLVFDGAGKMAGKGTASFDAPALIVPFEAQNGTYAVNTDCTATMRWFGYHPTITAIDHFHNADAVLSDGGKRISLIYTSTEFPGGPQVPVESFTFSGHRM